MVNLYQDDIYDDPPYDLQSKEVLEGDILNFIHMGMATFTFQMKTAIDQARVSQEKM